MAKTSTQRSAKRRAEQRAKERTMLTDVWLTPAERAVIRPMIERKLKVLRR